MTRPFVNRVEEMKCLKQALDYDGKASSVLVFTGIGGMGKTALRIAFEDQVLKPNNVPYAVLDYDGDPNLRSIEATLRTIRRQMGRYKVKTPVFDYLYARYFELSTGFKLSSQNFPPELEGVVTILEGIPGFGNVTQILHGLTQLGLVVKERLQHKEWLYRLRDLEPREVLNLMPEVLAEDLEEAMSSQSLKILKALGCRIVLIMDAYERLAESQIDDTLHRKLLLGTPHLMRVVLTRDPLPWEYAYPQEWRGKVEHHPALEVLAREDAVLFLRKKGIESPALHDHLYQLTGGYPFHLELCADICGEILTKGQEPGVSDFEELLQVHDLTEELVVRLLRQLAPEERDLMALTVYPRWVSEEILEELSSVPESVPRIFKKFQELSVFSLHPEISGAYVIRKEVRDCLFQKQRQRKRIWKKMHSKLALYHQELWQETQSYHHLREVIYHRFYDDAEVALKLFEEQFWKLLDKFNFSEAEGLLEAVPQETLSETAKRNVNYAWARLLTAQPSSKQGLTIAKNIYENLVVTETQEKLLDPYLFAFGNLLRTLGDFTKALNCHQRILNLRSQVYDKEHPNIADSYNMIGVVYTDQGEYTKALENHQKALAIYLKVYGNTHPEIANSYNSIGIIYESKGEYEKALEYFQKSLAICKQVYGNEHPRVAKTYGNIGVVYDLQGECEKALDYYKNCLAILLRIYGESHPLVAKSYNNIGVVYWRSGDCDKALDFHNKSLTIYLKTFGSEHPNTARSYHSIGVVFWEKGEKKKALEFLEKSLAIRLKVHGEEHPDVAHSYNNVGIACAKQGEFSKALDFLQKSLAIRLKVYGEEHPDVAETYYDMGEAYYDQSQYQKALDYFQKAHMIWLKAFGKDHPDIAKCNNGCATALWALKREDEAIDKIRKSAKVYCAFSRWKDAVKNLDTLSEWLEKIGNNKEAEETRTEADKIRKEHGLLPMVKNQRN